jgi:hypothetical protein
MEITIKNRMRDYHRRKAQISHHRDDYRGLMDYLFTSKPNLTSHLQKKAFFFATSELEIT